MISTPPRSVAQTGVTLSRPPVVVMEVDVFDVVNAMRRELETERSAEILHLKRRSDGHARKSARVNA